MNELIKVEAGSAVTMSSMELVEFINSQRRPNEAVLAHSDFMKKVPAVLGEGSVGNFSDTYLHPQNKQVYPCYRLPKREACLMAMSYSYELQAKVFDRMTELEGKARIPSLPELLRQHADCGGLIGAHKIIGVTESRPASPTAHWGNNLVIENALYSFSGNGNRYFRRRHSDRSKRG